MASLPATRYLPVSDSKKPVDTNEKDGNTTSATAAAATPATAVSTKASNGNRNSSNGSNKQGASSTGTPAPTGKSSSSSSSATKQKQLATNGKTAAAAVGSGASPAKKPRNRKAKHAKDNKEVAAAVAAATASAPTTKKAATLTRLAALIGQIKEACLEHGELAVKIAPLIETATRVIEQLSEKGQHSGTPQVQATDAAKPATTKPAPPANRAGESNKEATTTGKPTTAPGSVTAPATAAYAGARIPPYIYKPQHRNRNGAAGLFQYKQQPPTPPYGPTFPLMPQQPDDAYGVSRVKLIRNQFVYTAGARPGGLPAVNGPMAVPLPRRPVQPPPSPELREQLRRDQLKLQLRTKLRQAETLKEFEQIMLEAQRLGMADEAKAAEGRIARMTAASAAGTGGQETAAAAQ